MTLRNKSVMDPGLTDSMQNLKLDIFRTINCVKIGRIQSFDASHKTASINLLFKRVLPNGTLASYPVLVDCPVFTLQGGGAGIQFPIEAGDEAIVLFSDRNLDAWFATGSASAPLNSRSHDLADGIALVGLNSLTSTFPNYQAGKSRWFCDGAEIDLAAQIVTVKNDTTTLLTLMNAFIDVLTAISTNPGGGPLNGASVAALNAFKLQWATLLG